MNGEYQVSLELFDSILQENSQDGPAHYYADLARQRISSGVMDSGPIRLQKDGSAT